MMIRVRIFGRDVSEVDIFEHVLNELTHRQVDALLDECIRVSYRTVMPDDIDDRLAYIFKLMLTGCKAHFIEAVILGLMDSVECGELDRYEGRYIEVRR